MFESGFIGVEYIVTFTVAGWAVLGSPVAVCVAPVCFIGNSDALFVSTPPKPRSTTKIYWARNDTLLESLFFGRFLVRLGLGLVHGKFFLRGLLIGL